MGLLLYGFDTESYALGEKHSLGLRREEAVGETFGRKREEVTED
jgi:hypothetical protein